MKERNRDLEARGAVELLEEATHLLRLCPLSRLACYYIGTAPFVLGFLYFWADMSHGAFAHAHAAESAVLLSVLFVWMKCWHSVFCRGLKARICGEAAPRWQFRRTVRMAASQLILQSTGLVALPVAIVVVLPFGWMYAFYQNASLFGDGEGGDLKQVHARSMRQATLYPKQNHVLILILCFFGLFVCLNVLTLVYLVPMLLKSLLGIDTMFSKTGWSYLNTTVLAVVAGMSFLALDPLVKAAYVLRCFYGESMHTGEDLMVELRGLAGVRKALSVLLLAASGLTGAMMCGTSTAHAALDPQVHESGLQDVSSRVPGSTPVISPEEFNEIIEEVINRREYSWRMPREKVEQERDRGMIASFIDAITNAIMDWLRPVGQWFKGVMRWLAEKLLTDEIRMRDRHGGGNWMQTLQWILFTLVIAGVCILAVFFLRWWKRRRNAGFAGPEAELRRVPYITDEEILADELPVNSWLKLAQDLMARGEARLALRALYLACLSHLADKELISIARFKSNRDYERELGRRARSMPALLSAFGENVRTFEMIWYGMHDVTDAIRNDFGANQERIMAAGEERQNT